MLKYYNYDIVFQEIPDEVTLAINITHCPNNCEGCHSPHLREDIGEVLDYDALDRLLARYADSITCVCFMGGDSDLERLQQLADYVHAKYPYKVGWYSGRIRLPKDRGGRLGMLRNILPHAGKLRTLPGKREKCLHRRCPFLIFMETFDRI